jgi:hypothetical protein
MKKSILSVNVWLSVCAIALTGCHNVLNDYTSSQESNENRNSTVSKRIASLKEAGLLDSFMNQTDRSAQSDPVQISDVDLEKTRYFILHTDSVLDEIAQSENADLSLQFIDALVNGGTIGEIADIMAQISEEMAQEYLQTVEAHIGALTETTGSERSLTGNALLNIHLNFYDAPYASSSRAAAINLDQTSVNVYYGFCAATIAGLSAYRWCAWWQPWVGIAGLITAGAGAASMTIELGLWYACTDFKTFVNALISAVNNPGNYQSSSTTINALFQSSVGSKLVQILISTGGVAGFALAVTPELVWAVVSAPVKAWNSIAVAVKNAIGFTPIVQIPIAPITL